MYSDFFATRRVTKAQAMGVQRLTGDAIRSAAVEVIAEERMGEVREVDADLMRASRRQAQREKRKSAMLCKSCIVCDGAFSLR